MKHKWIAIILLLAGCSPRGPLALFQQLSPHERYAERLKSAGLDKTGLGSLWLTTAVGSYKQELTISLPYRETGYFSATQAKASALRFEAKRGQLLKINIAIRPAGSFTLFADLAQVQEDQNLKTVASADSTGTILSYEVKKTGAYILRLQPELLKGGGYTLTIRAGPSLRFPVAISGHPRVESFWGDSRDSGGRKHEGIDIFVPKSTPALAAANGTITRVTENTLGGKVVFMRPQNEEYNLYYAHLEVQLVHEGQQVMAGDTVGLIDNTGNAKNTPTHLHFGIYAEGGAVDPLPFVQRKTEEPLAIKLPLARLNDTLRLTRSAEPVTVLAISADRYKVSRIDGASEWLSANNVKGLSVLRKAVIKNNAALYDRPDTTAAKVTAIKTGSTINVLATYQKFDLVRLGPLTGWIYRP